jgi:hypothetical protein
MGEKFIVHIIKIPEIIAKIFAINNCERASYFFGLCEYSVNKKISIEKKKNKKYIFKELNF